MDGVREQAAESGPLRGDEPEVLTQGRSDEPPGTDQRPEQEIFERKRAADALLRSAGQWHAAFDAVGDGIALMNLEGRFLRCNKALAEILGKGSDEIVGSPCCKVVHGTSEPIEGCPLVRARHSRRREVLAITIGSRRFNVIVDPLMDESGGLIGAVHILSDITDGNRAEEALKQSQERHRAMIEGLPVGLFRKQGGPTGAFLLANQALVGMFGCESRDEFLQADMSDFCESPDDWAAVYDELLAQGRVIAKEMRLKTKDGTPVWGALTANVVRDDSGEIEYVNGLIEDITERNLLENQLAQAQKLEAMGQLAAGIAHEINTPIQYVGDNTRFAQEAFAGLLALLQEHERLLAEADVGPELLARFKAAAEEADLKYLLEDTPAAIEQSLEGVGRVVEIVRAMKEFAHPHRAEKVPTDINKTIESTITLARNEWKYVADMQTDFDPELPAVPVLEGDFKQVILNILVNAAHAIEDAAADQQDGKGQITVSTRRDGDWAEIRIGDTGTGIPEEISGRVFELFFTTKEVGKGTGQGLAIARAVVAEKHGGTIALETEVGKGTTFIIRLPLEPDPSSG